jgi:hypothetical protein
MKANPPDLVLITMWHLVGAINYADRKPVSLGNSLARMIEMLPTTSRAVIIEDAPSPGQDVPTCLSRYPNDFQRCDYSRAAGFSELGAMETVAAKATGSPIVDLTSEICPGSGACPVVINNMIVWRDGGHFTATFSRSLGPALDRKLATAVATPEGTP